MARIHTGWTRREVTVEVNGLRLHLGVWGPGASPPVLLLHGGAANTHWWDWLAPELAGPFRVFALDFPGHGRSAWPRPARYLMADFVAAAAGAADALELRRPHMVGHSMGGKVAMLLAASCPQRLGRLVLVDATPAISFQALSEMRRIGARPQRLLPSRREAARAFRLIPPETGAPRTRLQALALRSTRHRGHGRFCIGPDREFFSRIVPQVAWPVLSHISCPTLILRAERSSILSRRTAETMRRVIPGAELRQVPGTYHHLVLERPEEVGRAIRDFLVGQTHPG
ncbi:MAG TPA: alpha/beta hydrolase [Candidatus Methylomirabilis sp.]|nr:alpha/beta hydrolase [Candidatus Methylomirabilis sp.]